MTTKYFYNENLFKKDISLCIKEGIEVLESGKVDEGRFTGWWFVVTV